MSESEAITMPPLSESAVKRIPTVYFIDDSATMREVIKIAFRRESINVITCADAAAALAQFAQNPPDAVITDVIQDSFVETGYSAADIDWFVPHQANKRIIDASAVKLGIAPEKVVITVDKHGNTSAASIPLALSVAVADGRIKKGDLILLEAMGGGFTWGATLLRW